MGTRGSFLGDKAAGPEADHSPPQLHAFFDLGTRWRWVVSFTPQPLYLQGKRTYYPLDVEIQIRYTATSTHSVRYFLILTIPDPRGIPVT
jgi:hypothetical protein